MIKNMEIGYVNSTKAVKKVALHQKGKTFFFSLSALIAYKYGRCSKGIQLTSHTDN